MMGRNAVGHGNFGGTGLGDSTYKISPIEEIYKLMIHSSSLRGHKKNSETSGQVNHLSWRRMASCLSLTTSCTGETPQYTEK